MVNYIPMRVSHVVISRPGPDLKWRECARFDGPIAASDYCIYLRRRATNPGFECMFIESDVSDAALRAVDTEARDANANGDVILPSCVFDLVQQALGR